MCRLEPLTAFVLSVNHLPCIQRDIDKLYSIGRGCVFYGCTLSALSIVQSFVTK